MTTTNLGAPLALFTATDLCDKRGQHELRLITDGHRAYAYSTEHGGTDSPSAWRDGSTVVVVCGQPTPHDGDPCDGEARFDLATPIAWVPAEGDDLGYLLAHGQVIA